MEAIEGVESAIGVGLGFWRFGRGELGGEVADIAVVKGIERGMGKAVEGDALTRGVRVGP